MTYDAARAQSVMFGTYDDATWLPIALGAECRVNADCPGGFCTDGVCCNVPACGPCATCAGTSPGRCAPVTNHEDPDSCAASAGKSCDSLGVCKQGLGQASSRASECASGFAVDGVCCDSACDGKCVACRADLKASQSRDGVCDFALAGTDLREQCAPDAPSTCQHDGSCDGRGQCRLYTSGVACGATGCVQNRATGLVCNGLGTCTNSVDGVPCGGFACTEAAGCRVTCASDSECAPAYRCASAHCVANELGVCDGDTLKFADGTAKSCAPYACTGTTCALHCVSVSDCALPYECDGTGQCILYKADNGGGGGGCTTSPVSGSSALFCALGAVLLTLRKKRTPPRVRG